MHFLSLPFLSLQQPFGYHSAFISFMDVRFVPIYIYVYSIHSSSHRPSTICSFHLQSISSPRPLSIMKGFYRLVLLFVFFLFSFSFSISRCSVSLCRFIFIFLFISYSMYYSIRLDLFKNPTAWRLCMRTLNPRVVFGPVESMSHEKRANRKP